MISFMGELLRTPLYERHRTAGAKMVPFGGWEMPLQYGGILSEHNHTRTAAGLFDVSHMGELLVQGPKAEQELDRILTCRLDDLDRLQCRYGFLLRSDGGILDDLIVFKIREDRYMLCVNSSTTGKDARWIREHLRDSELIDASRQTAKLDLQGPLADSVMNALLPEAVCLSRFRFCEGKIGTVDVIASRTGYTGERGFELFFSADAAEDLWDTLIDGAGVRPVGLGARDTLRLEKGYPLYGADIDETRNPVEAGFDRFLCRGKSFVGRDALPGPGKTSRVLTGFVCDDRRSSRAHHRIYDRSEVTGGKVSRRPIGEVTSGAFSPSLKRGIGLGYVDRESARSGAAIVLSDGRTTVHGKIKPPPLLEAE